MHEFAGILQRYQYFGWLAFAVTVFLTPVAIRVAFRTGVLDIPDRKLKPHARPIPYLGGTAIVAGWSVALVVAMAAGVCTWRIVLPLLAGGVAMSVLGLVDDVRTIAPKVRLAVGTVVIVVAISLSGAGQHLADAFVTAFGVVIGRDLSLPGVVDTPVSILLGTIIVLGACNSTNLIDGLDGLCSGVTAIISLGFFLLAAHIAVGEYSATGDPVRMVLAVAMVGASLGFLPWNFNPAKVFMGDAGSVLLGYNCGMLIILFGERAGILRWVVGALMIFALPVFDTALAMFRRWRAGRSIFEGDRSHFYDQLVQRGWTVRQTVLISYGLALFYTAVGLTIIFIRTRYALAIYVLVCAATAAVAYLMGLTHPEEPEEMKLGERTPDGH